MTLIDKALASAIPPELLELARLAGGWFANSGYKEKLAETGTTGIQQLTVYIEGQPHVLVFAISRLNPAENERLTTVAMDITQQKISAEEEP